MNIPTRCNLCDSIAQGKDLDIAKSPSDRAHLLRWSDKPDDLVLFCKSCWRKLERVIRR